MPIPIKILVWRVALVAVFIVLAWRVSAIGIARFYAERVDERGADAAQQVRDWYPRQPEVLYRLGLENLSRDEEQARELLADAYRLDVTDPRPLLVLGGLAEAAGDQELAEQLVSTAAALAPVNASVQEDAAAFWYHRGRLDRALTYWSRAIDAGSPKTSTWFNVFRQLLRSPEGIEAFRVFAGEPPQWWLRFFTETARGTRHVELVKLLYRLRREAAHAPLTSEERNAYIAHLLRVPDFEEAYLAWVNSLLPQQRRELGLLYNGGFEQPLSGFGFDWHVTKLDGATVARAPVDGARGLALRITFRFSKTRFDGIYQPLYLAPGAYRITGRSRGDQFYSDSGLRWTLNCRAPQRGLLAESRTLLGNEQWGDFSFEAEVPESCRHQELRLVSADSRLIDLATHGTIWFDDLAIRRIDALSPGERARLSTRWSNEAGSAPMPAPDPSQVGTSRDDVEEGPESPEADFETRE